MVNNEGNIEHKQCKKGDIDVNQNFKTFIIYQPIVGLLITLFLSLFFLLMNTQRSINLLFFSLSPFIIYFAIYILFYCFSKKLNKRFFLNRKFKYVFFSLIFIIIALHILMYNTLYNT